MFALATVLLSKAVCLLVASCICLLLFTEGLFIGLLVIFLGMHVSDKLLNIAESRSRSISHYGAGIMLVLYPTASCISAFLLASILVPTDRLAIAWVARILAAVSASACAVLLERCSLKLS